MAAPGTAGERYAQELFGTTDRAEAFYRDQLLDTLTPRMSQFLARQTMMVIASVDAEGRPDSSVRFGEPGFVTVLDERTLAWPELRGNGVHTTLGNLLKNPAAHLMFLDHDERIGLHLRGEAAVLEPDRMAEDFPQAVGPASGRAPERWVVLTLSESYIHCRKHFPRTDAPVDWGTDDVRTKGGDYFGARGTPSPWAPEPPRGTKSARRPKPTRS